MYTHNHLMTVSDPHKKRHTCCMIAVKSNFLASVEISCNWFLMSSLRKATEGREIFVFSKSCWTLPVYCGWPGRERKNVFHHFDPVSITKQSGMLNSHRVVFICLKGWQGSSLLTRLAGCQGLWFGTNWVLSTEPGFPHSFWKKNCQSEWKF